MVWNGSTAGRQILGASEVMFCGLKVDWNSSSEFTTGISHVLKSDKICPQLPLHSAVMHRALCVLFYSRIWTPQQTLKRLFVVSCFSCGCFLGLDLPTGILHRGFFPSEGRFFLGTIHTFDIFGTLGTH